MSHPREDMTASVPTQKPDQGRAHGAERDSRRRLPDANSAVHPATSFRTMLEMAPHAADMERQLIRADRLAALGTLLAGIAHEMNNPLAYVLLGIEQMSTQMDEVEKNPSALPRVREILAEVRQGANRVAAVVRQLRSTSRPDAPEEGQVAVDVGEALRAALRVAGNEIRHRARLVTALGAVPVIEGSGARLEQVFLNLLVNAAQALPDGRAENEITVTLQARMADETIVVEIGDNGDGIPREVLPRIFDPFFTTKEAGVGMGLGLSICRGIVSAHGGTIDVASECGRGTRFRVLLPLRRTEVPDGAPVERSTPAPVPTQRRRRVLVVDDEPMLCAMLRNALEDIFEVDVVTGGRLALDRLSTGADYHAILCDIMMPEMTGMELYALAAVERPGIERRFVFMTGGAFTVRAAEFLASVHNRRLEKPFDISALRAVLDGQ